MSLPEHFANDEDYFEETIHFLHNYQNLFKYANTKILINEVLNYIDDEYLENLDVFENNFSLNNQNSQIKEFVERINKLKVELNVNSNSCNLEEYKTQVPLGAKKKHEILYLAKEIQRLCEDINVDTVVDFGSGLGYLDQMIFDTCKYKVLGIECDKKHYVGAKTRQRKYHQNTEEHVKYVVHTVNDGSTNFIQDCIKDKFGKRSFCMTGLHACADLTISAMNIFIQTPDAKAMVLMPCCYHRLAKNSNGFVNFPLSDSLKNVVGRVDGNFLDVPFLRLAAQPPKPTDDLQVLVFNLLARATLEFYAYKHGFVITRRKRKAVKVKQVNLDFKVYSEDAAENGFSLTCQNKCIKKENKCSCNLKFDLRELNEIWDHFSKDLMFKKAAIYILMQISMQPLCEYLVLYDRIVYLKEKGVRFCDVKKIVDESISPRCLALVTSK